MEIEFSNICYQEIKNLSFKINKHTVTAISGDATKEIIASLITGFIKPEEGSIVLDNYMLTNKTTKNQIKEIQKQIGYIFGNSYDYLQNLTVKNEILLNLKILKLKDKLNKCKESLNLVGLDSTYLEKKSFNLSSAEQYKVMLASILAIEPKVLILNQIDNYLSHKEQIELKKLIKRLKLTTIIISNNANFYFDIVDKIIITMNYKIKLEGSKDILYDKKTSKYLDIPPIIKFIIGCNDQAHKIKKYDEIDELMKEIYRNVNER